MGYRYCFAVTYLGTSMWWCRWSMSCESGEWMQCLSIRDWKNFNIYSEVTIAKRVLIWNMKLWPHVFRDHSYSDMQSMQERLQSGCLLREVCTWVRIRDIIAQQSPRLRCQQCRQWGGCSSCHMRHIDQSLINDWKHQKIQGCHLNVFIELLPDIP